MCAADLVLGQFAGESAVRRQVPEQLARVEGDAEVTTTEKSFPSPFTALVSTPAARKLPTPW